MERGEISRHDFMEQIRGLTTEIVEKIRGGMGKEVHGRYEPLEVECPRCGASPFNETFRTFECPGCKLIVWKMMAAREFEREEVVQAPQDGARRPLEGFRSKLGRAFSAVVTLERRGVQAEVRLRAGRRGRRRKRRSR